MANPMESWRKNHWSGGRNWGLQSWLASCHHFRREENIRRPHHCEPKYSHCPPSTTTTTGWVITPSCLSLQHRCFEINSISWRTLHLSISFASFCNIAQTGGDPILVQRIAYLEQEVEDSHHVLPPRHIESVKHSSVLLLDRNQNPAGVGFFVSNDTVITANHNLKTMEKMWYKFLSNILAQGGGLCLLRVLWKSVTQIMIWLFCLVLPLTILFLP